jgi:hypothetical protein
MLEVADIVRLHGAAYRARFGDRLLPSHARAMHDIEACRTAYFGGHLKQCDSCGRKRFSYHSCGNRHCPKCHGEQTERWLERQRARILPCRYYLLTFTLPGELRALARSHQKALYAALMRSAAAALQALALDARYLGARIGALAVLHTWTRALAYHPHVHLLATAGGLSADGAEWIAPKHHAYLVPVHALSVLFRAKMCAALKLARLLDRTPRPLWKKNWVVHCQSAGAGDKVLEYLGRYVFRVALANSRLESIDNGQVSFRYRDRATQRLRRVSLPALEFLARFLQHVLPRGLAKVRYYGIFSGTHRALLEQARALLSRPAPRTPPACSAAPSACSAEQPALAPAGLACPHCHTGRLRIIDVLPPHSRSPP